MLQRERDLQSGVAALREDHPCKTMMSLIEEMVSSITSDEPAHTKRMKGIHEHFASCELCNAMSFFYFVRD